MLNLVVIGDSIAKGYGSTDYKTDSFGAVLGEKLSADVENLGIVGLDTTGLLQKLDTEKFQDAIGDADVICLSIGSNDLLKPFLSIFAQTLGVDGEEKELFSKIQDNLSASAKKNPLNTASVLSTAMKKMTNNKQLDKACEDFPQQFNEIIQKIYEINPDALIYANNIYNPYYGVAYEYGGISIFNISQLCEPYIQKLNSCFNSSDKYTVVDMYSIFRQSGYTHVNSGSLENMSQINLDPHPNNDGYRMMADYIYTKLDSTPPILKSAEYQPGEESCSGKIKLSFSENVRLVKGGQLVISSAENKDNFVYKIEENKWVEAVEDETAVLNLELDDFVAADNNKTDKLISGNDYILTAVEASIKDKGNNHLEEKELLKFTVEKEGAELIETNTVSVKNPQNNSVYVITAAGIVILAAFIIILIKIKKVKSIDIIRKQ